jgi:tetratricopeptide (TPR) repeat protein
VDARGFSEKREFVDAARRVLAEAAPLVAPPGGRWKPAPSLAATTEETTTPETTTRAEAAKEGRAPSASSSSSAAASSAGAKRADEGKREREPREEDTRDAAASASAADASEASAKARASSDVGARDDSGDRDDSGARDDSDSDTDEETRAATLAAMSASAKRRGNEAFAAGDFARANKQFTMAIRMDKTNHVLFSNRSAARCGLGQFEEALADAERCVRMAPKWGKGYGRKGAALTGLGQGGEAVKAYVAGLAAEPGNEALREGLAEAKRAIRAAQDRYEEMWGKPAPGAAEEE